jgi:nucleoside-diphosphate-sugar epimerase
MPAESTRILVTGAGGFIGSHVVEHLARKNQRVTALIHYNANRHLGNLQAVDSKLLASVDVVLGDINDPEFVGNLVQDQEVVIHLAALIGIPYSYQSPRSYLQTNAEGTLNLLEACRRHRPRRFVFTSTSEVYGSARQVPIDENHPLQAQSPYSASKIAAEALVEAYRRNFSVPAVILRPFNTFGPRQSPRAVIPTIITQALAGGPLRLGRTDTVRDFTFIDDTVEGILAAALGEDIGGGPYNLGTGTGQTIEEAAREVLAQLHLTCEIVREDRRLRPELGEVDRLISSHEKFHRATGWKPRVAFAEGLRQTIAFWKKNPPADLSASYAV